MMDLGDSLYMEILFTGSMQRVRRHHNVKLKNVLVAEKYVWSGNNNTFL